MKVIIAGSRSITDYNMVKDAVNMIQWPITEIVSGGANGVDKLGEQYAIEHIIDLKVFPADWNTYGKSSGFRRNQEMAKYADALIAVWDGESRGTKHMIELMLSEKKPVYVSVN